MGLDTKRAEMAKLEERARQRAAALAQVRTRAAQLFIYNTRHQSEDSTRCMLLVPWGMLLHPGTRSMVLVYLLNFSSFYEHAYLRVNKGLDRAGGACAERGDAGGGRGSF